MAAQTQSNFPAKLSVTYVGHLWKETKKDSNIFLAKHIIWKCIIEIPLYPTTQCRVSSSMRCTLHQKIRMWGGKGLHVQDVKIK